MRIRTGYSFRFAAGRLNQVADAMGGMTTWPITDRASTFGFSRWAAICEKYDARPAFGVEIAVSDTGSGRKPDMDHWTFIAIDDVSAIHKLLNLATQQFHYEPVLTYQQAQEAEGVLKIVGRRAKLELVEAAEHLAFGVGPGVNKAQVRRAKEKGLDLIAVNNNVYPTPEDKDLYQAAMGKFASVQTYPQHILSGCRLHDFNVARFGKEIADQATDTLCHWEAIPTAELKRGVLLTPDKPDTLEGLCRTGAEKLGIDLEDPIYGERLEYELKLIGDKDYEDYFFIIADLVAWARERMAVGPARGSSCGSLVCYLLGITTVDPIPYGLIFERFIDINRSDLPDIDIDFDDVRRDEATAYLEQTYGPEHVARLGTVNMFQIRSALNDTLLAFNLPTWESGAVAETSNNIDHALDNTDVGRKLKMKYPVIDVARKLVDHPRHAGQHAAGIVLTNEPVGNFVTIDARTGATHCDKEDAEELGLLKIDALGLTQLSVFGMVCEAIGQHPSWLNDIPLDDEATFEIFRRRAFAGIFQFTGDALKRLSEGVPIETINDVVALTALARPGPLQSGGAHQWVQRRKGAAPVEYDHPALEPFLKETLGVLVYQEQVMAIARQIGGLSWPEVTKLRKAMGKSQGLGAMEKWRADFVTGAKGHDFTEDQATDLFGKMVEFGAYAFNKSHAVAYGIVSYQCAYLKAHHMVEFSAATLTRQSNPERQLEILRELDKEGLSYLPVHPELSTLRWEAGTVDGQRVLIGPLTNVKGIGQKTARAIMSTRARPGEELPAGVAKKLEQGVTAIGHLYPIQARVDELYPDGLAEGLNIHSKITPCDDVDATEKYQSFLVIGRTIRVDDKDGNDPERVASRGYAFKGPSMELNIRVQDDSGDILCKIGRKDYPNLAKRFKDENKNGKTLWCIKGKASPGFSMIWVDMFRKIGELE